MFLGHNTVGGALVNSSVTIVALRVRIYIVSQVKLPLIKTSDNRTSFKAG